MDKFCIKGGVPLKGRIKISGAKNAVLPIIAASILHDGEVILESIPHLKDVTTMLELMGSLGVKTKLADKMSIHIDSTHIHNFCAPYELVKTMRASILVLGPLLGRYGEATVSLPGGCAIGSRPVDLHLQAMQALGAMITVEHGFIHAKAPDGLKGAVIHFPKITVTGTENAVMAAVLARGQTVIHNAAKEPEIENLCDFLNKSGARISGIGTDCLTIEGVKSLSKVRHKIIPDRIEAATYLVGAALTRGSITLDNVIPEHLISVLELLKEAGASVTTTEDTISLDMHGRQPQAISMQTKEYPGVPTDVQAQFMALNCLANGKGSITETIFENRFMHAHELSRMGAKLAVDGNCVTTVGIDTLTGTQVMATDLRASAGLVLAALMAKGETTIHRIYHIDRGYECIEEKLSQLGADIKRMKE
jgi:UDP-N-acetylglucosamine 1-carboxyvinyltransferase